MSCPCVQRSPGKLSFASPQQQMELAVCEQAQRRRPARFHSSRPSLIQHVFEAPQLYKSRGPLRRALLAAAGISATAAGPLAAGAQPSAELLAAGVAAATSATAAAPTRSGATARSRAAARGGTAARSRTAASRSSRTGTRGRTAARGGSGTTASRRRCTAAGVIRLDAGDQRQAGHDGHRKNETVHRVTPSIKWTILDHPPSCGPALPGAVRRGRSRAEMALQAHKTGA